MEIKEAKDLLNLPWVKLTDWQDLIPTYEAFGKGFCICRKDIMIFVESKYYDIARQLKLPRSEVKEFIEKENEQFYSLVDELTKSDEAYISTDAEKQKFERLKKTFRLPKIE